MIMQKKSKHIDGFAISANAPLQHIFDDHVYCNVQWCQKLKAQQEGKTYNHPEYFLDHTAR